MNKQIDPDLVVAQQRLSTVALVAGTYTDPDLPTARGLLVALAEFCREPINDETITIARQLYDLEQIRGDCRRLADRLFDASCDPFESAADTGLWDDVDELYFYGELT